MAVEVKQLTEMAAAAVGAGGCDPCPVFGLSGFGILILFYIFAMHRAACLAPKLQGDYSFEGNRPDGFYKVLSTL
jgi:hypothetical protein